MALALAFGLLGSRPATAAGSEVSLFTDVTPQVSADPDSGPVELGVVVIPGVDGTVTGVRFLKGSANVGPHTGTLWSSTGTRLATATFTDETATGWQQVTFAAPVAVQAGQRYVASYHAPKGRYAATNGFFADDYVRGPLRVPAGGGVYRYGDSAFPSSTWADSNYFVDVAFVPATAAPDTRAPTIGDVTVSSATATSATISWTTDEPATTQIAYGTSTGYGSATTRDTTLSTTHRQTLTGLSASTAYRFQVRSSDAAGNTAASSDAGFTTAAAPTTDFDPGNPNGTASVPAGRGLADVSNPDRVVGTGTAASCTSAALVAAVRAGGVVTFDCGSEPTTITLTETLKVRNSTSRLVLDGGGLVTLSGGDVRRILYIDTCDTSLGSVSGNCLYAPTGPQVTVQNLTFTRGNATNDSYVSPGDVGQGSNGGGAIFALGGRLTVVRSVFTSNICASTGPDLGGGAIRVLAQHSPTPNDLDASWAARNQEPVTIVQSTFGGASGEGNRCSNGGAISGLRTPITVVNSRISHNSAVGCCANPAKSGTPGGGSGGAIYTDGGTYDLTIAGSDLRQNTAQAGGSSIFYVSNSRTGHLRIDRSVSTDNRYVLSPYGDQHFQNHPGIFYLGDGEPVFTDSTIE